MNLKLLKQKNKDKLYGSFVILGRMNMELILAFLGQEYYSVIVKRVNLIINPILSKSFDINEDEVFMKLIHTPLIKIRDYILKRNILLMAGSSKGLKYLPDKEIITEHITKLMFGKPIKNKEVSNLFDYYFINTHKRILAILKDYRLKKLPSLYEQLWEEE